MTERQFLDLVKRKMPFAGELTLDSTLVEDLGFDSALLMDLILSIEEYYGCFLSEHDLTMDQLRTPRRLWQLIERQRAGKEDNDTGKHP